MFYEMKHAGKRKYTQKRRAEQQEETRAKIVEATMALHEQLGPRATTISAIAERAGVQRLTVYRHFPNESAVFAACTGRWLELHPPPQSELWEGAEDRIERCRRALAAHFDYYRRTAAMWRGAYRDLDAVPALQAPMSQVAAALDATRDGLLRGWRLSAARRRDVAATLGHCLLFSTWQSLEAQGLSDEQMTELAGAWLAAAAGGRSS